jgi:hypothetical protein
LPKLEFPQTVENMQTWYFVDSRLQQLFIHSFELTCLWILLTSCLHHPLKV